MGRIALGGDRMLPVTGEKRGDGLVGAPVGLLAPGGPDREAGEGDEHRPAGLPEAQPQGLPPGLPVPTLFVGEMPRL